MCVSNERGFSITLDHNFKSPVYAWNFIADGHHKLVRWRIVTHCCIDGYSRLVVYIHCSANNRASTVYDLFLHAVEVYGLPSRVRCDQGTENIHVARHIYAKTSWSRKEISACWKFRT